MTIDLKMLGWSVFLGLAHVVIAASLATRQRGLQWNAGNRDGAAASLTGVAARAARASANFLETFPYFAAAVLAVATAGRNTPHTALGAELYFAARVLYLPIYPRRHSVCTDPGVGGVIVGTAAGAGGALLAPLPED